MKKTILILLIFMALPLYSQNATGGHRGGITSIINKGESVITSGEDGFIVTWDTVRRTAVERYQLTPYKIENLASNPVNDDICVIEAAGIDKYRISAWNYTDKKRLFLINSDTRITYINYSAGGNYLIVSGLDGSNLAILDTQTGEIVSSLEISGPVTLAVTGRSERFMLLYQGGYDSQIHYVEMENFTITESFDTPGNLSNHIIFGNNRFIAGVNSDGLHLVDAASGTLLDIVNYVGRNAILHPADDGFYCYNRTNTSSTLYRFTADRNGRFSKRQETPVPFDRNVTVTAISYNVSLLFASNTGALSLLGNQNRPVVFTQINQIRMTEFAAGKNNIAVLTETGGFFLIPADFNRFADLGNIQIINKSGYTRITAIPDTDQYILWQTANTRLPALLIDSKQPQNERPMNYLTGRFPLRAVSFLKDRLLTLDTSGNLSVRTMANMSARADYSFSSPGATDAAFINDQYLVLCRGAINNNSAFLFINYITGETVPVFYPAQAGLSIYTGRSGTAYAETAEHDAGRIKTSIINLSAARDPQGRNASSRIFQYHEETSFSIAESSGRLATVRGNEDALLISNGIINFQRTSGLPIKITGHDDFFVCFDSDGNITWHDNGNGELLAVFGLYDDRWSLKSENEVSGGVSRR